MSRRTIEPWTDEVTQTNQLDARDPRLIALFLRWPGRLLQAWHRMRVHGLDGIPPGPVLFVANHSGGKALGDGAFLFAYIQRFGTADPIFALVHTAFSYLPIVRRVFPRLGLVRASHAQGLAALRRGARVAVYPGGDGDAFRPWSERARPRLGGRTGFVLLAARAGVPMVPVATAGSHHTFLVLTQGRALARFLRLPRIGLHSFPVILCLPWIALVGPLCLVPYLPLPARIEVRVGQPIEVDPALAELERDDPRVEAVAARVTEALQEGLDWLYARR